MNKWIKNVALTSLLLGTSASLLSGCMAGKKSTNGNGATETVAIPDGIWDPYEKEVVLTTVNAESGGLEFQNGEDWDNNAWNKAIKDRFNITIKNEWLSNDYTTKLNLSIADGDLPDVFRVNEQQLKQLHDADLIMDLTELFDKYASDNLKSYKEKVPDTFQTGYFDGKLYGVPQLTYGVIDQFNYVWIRKDWKDELGLADPKTMGDVIAITQAFQKKYGGYGMAEQQSLDSMYRLAPAWGVNPKIWVETENGNLEYGSIQPKMKEVLKAYRDWYKAGVLNPNFTTQNQDKMFQELINGNTGVVTFAQWLGYFPGPDIIRNLGPDALFEPYAIPSATGEPVRGNMTFANSGYVVVNKNTKNPEAVFKLINFWAYMLDDAAGKETPEFINSLFSYNYPDLAFYKVINPDTDYDQYVQLSTALADYQAGKEVDLEALGKNVSKYNNFIKWMDEKDPTAVGDWLQQGNSKSAYGIAKGLLDNEQYVKDKLWGAQPPTLVQSGSTLDDILNEGFTKIITGEKEVDYFDEVVKQWKKAGGDVATEEVNAQYGK
ncbi:TPA: extracellular solute-binding protein [Streptococcus suis]|nr:extracellular solute-binding protein [Streptococcus suis]